MTVLIEYFDFDRPPEPQKTAWIPTPGTIAKPLQCSSKLGMGDIDNSTYEIIAKQEHYDYQN